MTTDLQGYATDIAYLRDFKPMLAPAWLDHVALAAGVAPPARKDGFAWCDLGCGQGVTAAILAATHPTGAFYGIDAMPAHIDHARRLAHEAAILNAEFYTADFTAALDLELPLFDYIVMHGVYTWVDSANQGALRELTDRRLKPGGLVYVSYNAMPGWARDLPFQRLVHDLASTFPGDSAQRLAAATKIIHSLADARVPALAASHTVSELAAQPKDYPPAYLVHEFMPAAWRPLYVTEVRAAMKTIGLAPVGSATLIENFDPLVLGETAREVLAAIADEDVRELVRDFYLDQRFRCDVFARGNRRLEAAERHDRLLASTFALARPATRIRYSITTAAGRYSYDNPAARTIVAALAGGPCTLAGLAPIPMSARDLLDNILLLCAAGDAVPGEPGRGPVEALNRAILRRLGGPDEIRFLALPCGTALELDPGLMRQLREGEEHGDAPLADWRGLLASHGL
jgi:SAM-dependent methyltransferase